MAEQPFPRLPITRPHTVINVDSSGIGGSDSGSEKVLCLIGKADGGKPNTVYELRNFAQAERTFRSGELVDAIRLAWGSNPNYTAGKILAMRIEDAKPASLIKGGLKIESELYGSEANGIQVALEKNTITDSLRLKVIFEADNVYNTYDNIGNIFKIEYKGDQESASYSVEKNAETDKAKRFVIKVAGKEVKSYNLEKGAYVYISDIISDMRELPDFEVKLSPFGDKNIKAEDLDEATDVDVKVKDGVYVKAIFGDIAKQTAYNGYVTFSKAGDEEVNTPSNVTVEPGENDAEVTAEGAVATGIEPFELTSLEGGTNGEPPASWSSKLEKFAHEGGYYIVPLTDHQSVHAEVKYFVNARSDAGEPMRAIIGGGINESKELLFSRQAMIKDPRVALIANSGYFLMEDGRVLHAPAYLVASAVGGLISGLDIGESITFKELGLSKVDQIYESADLDQLNENGIISIEYVRSRTNTKFRIVEDVTTFNDNTDPVKSEIAVGEANDFMVSELKVLLDDTFIGERTVDTSASQIKDFIISYLEGKKRDDEIQGFPPEDVQVIVEGKEARISMTVYPIRALKKITVSLVYKEQTLQA